MADHACSGAGQRRSEKAGWQIMRAIVGGSCHLRSHREHVTAGGRASTAAVFVLTGGQVLSAVSSSSVVADAGLVLSSASPCRPVQGVVDRRGLPVGEASDQASDLGEAEVDELGEALPSPYRVRWPQDSQAASRGDASRGQRRTW
jgi:hypothetical protein